MRGLFICGYKNSLPYMVVVDELENFDLNDLQMVTEGEIKLVPGKQYLGASKQHYYPSDVVLYVEDEDGCIPNPFGNNLIPFDSAVKKGEKVLSEEISL